MFKLITRDQLIYLRDSAPPEQVRVYKRKGGHWKLDRIEEPVDYHAKFNEVRYERPDK